MIETCSGRHHGEVAEPQPHQHGGHVRIGLVEAEQVLGQPLLLFDGQRLEQGLLAVEVDVERSLRDAGRLGDLAHAGPVEAGRHEDLARALQDLAALLALARLCALQHRRTRHRNRLD